jgi:hypothetical protein
LSNLFNICLLFWLIFFNCALLPPMFDIRSVYLRVPACCSKLLCCMISLILSNNKRLSCCIKALRSLSNCFFLGLGLLFQPEAYDLGQVLSTDLPTLAKRRFMYASCLIRSRAARMGDNTGGQRYMVVFLKLGGCHCFCVAGFAFFIADKISKNLKTQPISPTQFNNRTAESLTLILIVTACTLYKNNSKNIYFMGTYTPLSMCTPLYTHVTHI